MPELLLEPIVKDTSKGLAKGRLMLLSTTMGIGGGAEEQVMQLALALDSRGWRTMIVSMIPAESMPDVFERRDIGVVHLAMKVGVPDPRALVRLRRLIWGSRAIVASALARKAVEICEAEEIHAVEVVGCGLPAMREFEQLCGYRRDLPAWCYFYMAPEESLMQELADPAVWEPSSSDGDSSI